MHYTEMYLQSQVDYWKQKVERVHELHKPIIYDGRFTDYERCSHCYSEEEPLGSIYPCLTIKA